MKNQKLLKEKFGGSFLIFYVVTMFVFLIFPKQLVGNIYVMTSYLIGCLIFLFVFYNYKSKLKK
jgi:Ca2+/Na+ antiporter